MNVFTEHLEGWVAILLLVLAAWQEYRTQRLKEKLAQYDAKEAYKRDDHKAVDSAKDELIKVITEARDNYLVRFQNTYEEYKDYRDKAHLAQSEAQAKMLAISEEVATLRAKTDLTPLLANQMQQNEINKKILDGLGKALSGLDQMLGILGNLGNFQK